MKISRLLGLSLLAVGLVLLRETRRRRIRQQTFNGIVFHPTAIFIWQNFSKRPNIDFKISRD